MSQRRGFSTGEEWSAAYYLGLEQVVTRGFQGDFDSQVALGFSLLASAGYEKSHATLRQEGGSVLEACEWMRDEHQNACREIAAGSFDGVRRAREALRWLDEAVPGIDTTWLRRVLSAYDDAHTADPRGDRKTAPALSRWIALRSSVSPDGEPRLLTWRESRVPSTDPRSEPSWPLNACPRW